MLVEVGENCVDERAVQMPFAYRAKDRGVRSHESEGAMLVATDVNDQHPVDNPNGPSGALVHPSDPLFAWSG